jgi:hypothetical protein
VAKARVPKKSGYDATSQVAKPVGLLELQNTSRTMNAYGITEEGLDNLSTLNQDASILFSLGGVFFGIAIDSTLYWQLGSLSAEQTNLAKAIILISLLIAGLSGWWGYLKQKKQGTIISRMRRESTKINYMEG